MQKKKEKEKKKERAINAILYNQWFYHPAIDRGMP